MWVEGAARGGALVEHGASTRGLPQPHFPHVSAPVCLTAQDEPPWAWGWGTADKLMLGHGESENTTPRRSGYTYSQAITCGCCRKAAERSSPVFPSSQIAQERDRPTGVCVAVQLSTRWQPHARLGSAARLPQRLQRQAKRAAALHPPRLKTQFSGDSLRLQETWGQKRCAPAHLNPPLLPDASP